MVDGCTIHEQSAVAVAARWEDPRLEQSGAKVGLCPCCWGPSIALMRQAILVGADGLVADVLPGGVSVRLLDVECLVDDASFSSGGQTAYYVRGHMDMSEFIAYLDSEYGRAARAEFVRHTYMGFAPPDADGFRTAWFSKAARRGASPVTYFDLDGQERAMYDERRASLEASRGTEGDHSRGRGHRDGGHNPIWSNHS